MKVPVNGEYKHANYEDGYGLKGAPMTEDQGSVAWSGPETYLEDRWEE